MPETGVCGSCKFWVETGGTDSGLVGECHRNAPAPGLVASNAAAHACYAVWPVTAEKNWCGVFEDRPMATQEVIARVEMIQKMEAERKSKLKAG